MATSPIRRGDIVYVKWPHSDGGEKSRPTLVISSVVFNTDHTDIILLRIGTTDSEGAIRLAGSDRKGTGLTRDGWIHPHDIHTLEQDLIERKLGVVPPTIMKKVESSLREHLGL